MFFCIGLYKYFCALFVVLLPLNFFHSYLVVLSLSFFLKLSVLVGIHSLQPLPESRVNHHAGAKFWELCSSSMEHALCEQKLCQFCHTAASVGFFYLQGSQIQYELSHFLSIFLSSSQIVKRKNYGKKSYKG